MTGDDVDNAFLDDSGLNSFDDADTPDEEHRSKVEHALAWFDASRKRALDRHRHEIAEHDRAQPLPDLRRRYRELAELVAKAHELGAIADSATQEHWNLEQALQRGEAVIELYESGAVLSVCRLLPQIDATPIEVEVALMIALAECLLVEMQP